MRKGILIPVFLLIADMVTGQNVKIDTTIGLVEFEIISTRLRSQHTGTRVQVLDSISIDLARYDNLGSVLSKKTSVAVREYTYNGLNTVSMRGTSPRHTGLFWNGIKINPVNAGMVDLSLIPAGFFNNIYLTYGGASSVNGENSIGGNIHLVNEPSFSVIPAGAADGRAHRGAKR